MCVSQKVVCVTSVDLLCWVMFEVENKVVKYPLERITKTRWESVYK